VTYNNTPATIRDSARRVRTLEKLVSSSVTTAKDGTFSLAGLPPSVYWLCAAGTKPTHLLSCQWGSPTMRLDLTQTASVSNVKLQVTEGVLLTFNVSDPKGQIQEFPTTPTATSKPGNFRIFVLDGTHFMAATPNSVGAAVHQHTIAVPKSRTLQLFVSTSLKVNGSSLTATGAGAWSPPISVNGAPATFEYTIP